MSLSIFRCLKLDRADPLEFSSEVSDRVCTIIRKIFFTLHIYLSTDGNEEESKMENNGKNENEKENDDEEKNSHTSVKKIMLPKAVQGVRYILSQDKNIMNNNNNENIPSSSLSLINSFICYLPPNQIDEILKKRHTEKTNLADASSNLVLDSTIYASVLEKCIDFALSTYNSDTNIRINNNNKFNDDKCINNSSNNDNNNKNSSIINDDNNTQPMALTTNKNENDIGRTIEEDNLNLELELKLKLKTEAAMMLALLANKVV